MRLHPIQRRALALTAACTLLLGGTALWRQAAAPQLTLTDSFGDRAASHAFALDFRFGYETSISSTAALREGTLTTRTTPTRVGADTNSRLGWFSLPPITLRDQNGDAVTLSLEHGAFDVEATSSGTLDLALQCYTAAPAFDLGAALVGSAWDFLPRTLRSSLLYNAALPQTLQPATEIGSVSSRGATLYLADARSIISYCRLDSDSAPRVPLLTLRGCLTMQQGQPYCLLGPADDALADRLTGTIALSRIDTVSSFSDQPVSATLLAEFPLGQRTVIGLTAWGADHLLMVCRTGTQQVELTLLDLTGQTVSRTTLPCAGAQTELTLSPTVPAPNGGTQALLTLRTVPLAASPAPLDAPRSTVLCVLRWDGAQLTASPVWSADALGGMPETAALAGDQLALIHLTPSNDTQILQLPAPDGGTPHILSAVDRRILLSVYDIAGEQPALRYQGEIDLPDQPFSNQSPPDTDILDVWDISITPAAESR